MVRTLLIIQEMVAVVEITLMVVTAEAVLL
jgi:hypothetical protein